MESNKLSPDMARRRALRRRSLERGFTLVELLVAGSAGIVVAMAAILMSKNASQFFQHEARISATQLSVTLGMNRLQKDIQRAALLSTRNIQKDAIDEVLCGGAPTGPVGLTKLSGILIEQGGSALGAPDSVANGLNPDAIVIGGSLSTTEQFALRTTVAAGGGLTLRLEDDDALKRTRARALAGAGETIQELFATGRFVRIVDQGFKHEYGVIASVAEGPATDPFVDVTLGPTPAIPTAPPGACGLHGYETGAVVSVIQRVRYEIRSMAGDPAYGPLVAPVSAAQTGDGTRTELVRTELDETDTPMASGSLKPPELIAEYAVDLKFGVEIGIMDPATNLVSTTRHAIALAEDPLVYSTAADVLNGGGTPETIRSVQVRLATRARAPDRTEPLGIDLGVTPDGRLARFALGGVAANANYARVRALNTDVFLPNQASLP
jgi:hypothetical protein